MWNRERKCLNCGEEFGRWDRYNKQYCSATCRKQAQRKRQSDSAQELYNRAIAPISRFSKVSADERQKAIDSLKLLKTTIDDQLRLLKDEDTMAKIEMFESRKKP